MKKNFIFIILFITINLYSLNYITTAESLSWSGAYTSVADGFEAILYNPAGLYMTSVRYGLNLFGNYGVRVYTNSISTDHVLKFFEKGINNENATDLFTSFLNFMPPNGLDTGFDISMLNFMTYFRLNTWTLGVSVIPKTSFTTTLEKKIFESILQNLDLTEPVTANWSVNFIQYIDFSVNLSTRAKFLEKHLTAIDAIYVGITGHFYLPTMFIRAKSNDTSISSFKTNSVYGFYGYKISIKGDAYANLASFITEPIKASGTMNSLPDNGGDYINPLINQAGSVGFGFGVDMGFIVKFNRFVRVGFAINDLGFFVFPKTAKLTLNTEANLTPDVSSDSLTFNFDDFQNDLTNGMLNGLQNITDGSVQGWMPSMTFRLGVAVTPIRHKYIDLIIAADISVSDLNRTILGDYATFNIAMGVEFTPKVNWVEFPMRVAFSYNSQANNPALSFGLGLYLGPVEMEIAVKGIEILITEWGAKEVGVGLDFKLEF